MLIWLHVFLGCTRACMCIRDGEVIYVDYDLSQCSRWYYACSVNVE